MMKNSLNWMRILIVLTILGSGLAFPMVSATIYTKDGSELNESQLYELTNSTQVSLEEKSVHYFYDPDCESCQKVEEFIEPYLTQHPDTKIVKYNISHGSEEMEMFNQSKTDFNREKVFIPVMYFGSVALEGNPDIINNFESVYAWFIKE